MPKKESISDGFKELEEITAWFERDDIDLEEALKKFERGLELVKQLKTYVQKVEHRVVDIKKQFKDVLENDEV